MTHKVLLIGRPNVGKSTLFNRLCSKKLAIVDDTPGVTRDIRMHNAQLYDLHFIAIDTAGWTSTTDQILEILTNSNTENAINEASVILFLLDNISGITADDIIFTEKLRKLQKNIILVINKSEAGDRRTNIDKNDIYRLGFGDAIYISAIHGSGLYELYERLCSILPRNTEIDNIELSEGIKVAIVGRPNVGKSTMFNYLLGKQRSIVSEIPGTTRDCITDYIQVKQNTSLLLIDTAGMRKHNKIAHNIENMSLGQSITAIKRSHVTIIVMDATMPFEKQDLKIAKIAINEGKALIFVINKIDLLNQDIRNQIAEKLNEIVYNYLESIESVPIIYLSALYGKYFDVLSTNIVKVYNQWITQISTGKLNRWLKDVTTSKLPPLLKKRKTPISIKYITQKAIQPPTFIIFANTKLIPTSYLRYMKRSLAKRFNMIGIPIRFIIQTNENPYIKKN